MKKILSVFFVSLLISTNIFALEVDKTELQSTKSTTIEFISYTGPHKIIDSVEAIKGIGKSLGKEIAPSRDTSKTANLGNKYTVIHAIDENEIGKFDADIIFINKDANVDHITNLRRIISAYLVSAYDYSEADSDTLAVFITVYNAVYRGDLDSFKNKYKDVVVKNLSSNNCGLSVNYKDWPGASEIVIPLYDVKNGGLSTIETSVISDKKVVESMKEDHHRPLPRWRRIKWMKLIFIREWGKYLRPHTSPCFLVKTLNEQERSRTIGNGWRAFAMNGPAQIFRSE